MIPDNTPDEAIVDIVLFDDDAHLLEILTFHFRSAQYSFTTARNVSEFWSALERGPTRLVIFEPAMLTPHDRRRFIEWHDKTKVPVVLLTLDPREANVRFSIDIGSVGFVEKPFKLQSLLAIVQQAVESST